MANNLTLSVTLTGDGRQLSGTLRNAQGEVQAFGGSTVREGDRAERSLANVERRAGTVGRELQVLTRLAAPLGAAFAGMFAGRAIQSQIDYADRLQKTNLRIGASVEALSQYNHVAGLSGVAFEQLTTGWQRQTRRISEAAQGYGTATDALDTLGLSAEALNQLAPEEQFERIAEALQGVESQADRTALAMKLWDTEGVGLLQIVNQGTDAMRAMREEADRLGLTISQDTADAMANYNDEMARFQAVATGVTRQVASELVPAMTTGLQTASKWVDQMGGAAEILDTVKDAGTGVAVVMAGRYVGAIATSQAALAAKTAVVATTTGAINLLTGATTRQAAAATAMAGATRVATGALALIGGPAGAAVIAAGAIYYFREELGLTQRASKTTEEFLGDLREGMGDLDEAAIGNRLDVLVHDLIEVSLQAQETFAQLERLREAPRMYGQGMAADQRVLEQQTEQRLEEQRNKINALTQAIQEHRDRRNELTSTSRDNVAVLEDMTVTAQRLAEAETATAAATNELTRATNAQATAIENLRNRLVPHRSQTLQLAQDQNTLNLAFAMGRITASEYLYMIGALQTAYIDAQNDADDLATSTTNALYTMEGAMEELRTNGLRRLDDGFADLWQGAIDGSLNASEIMKRVLSQTLAEMAHMAITRPITVQLATSMGMGMGGGGVGGMGGVGGIGGLSPSSMGSALNALRGGFGGIQWTGAGGAQAYGGAGWANAATSGTGATGFMGGSMQNFSGMQGLASMGAGMAGTWLGSQMFGQGKHSSTLGTIGGAVGTFFGGPLGALAGSTLGSALGGLFGGSWETKDAGLNLGVSAGDITGNQYERQHKSGGWFSSSKSRTNTRALSGDLRSMLQEAYSAQEQSLALTLEVLGQQSSALNSFSSGLTRISTMGKSSDQVEKAVQRWLQNTVNRAAQSVVDPSEYAMAGETTVETLNRLATALTGVNPLLEQLHESSLAASLAGGDAAAQLLELAGGLDEFTARADYYYQNILTEAERQERAVTAAAQAMGAFTARTGRVIESTDALRELVDGIDLTTASGRELYNQAMNLAPALVEIERGLERVGQQFEQMLANASAVVSDAESQVRQAWQTFDRQSFSQQIELLNLMGDSEGALALERERELAMIDEALRPTQERIWAIQDEIAAQQNATQAARNYQRELSRVRDQLNQQLGNIGNWLDQQLATSGTPERNLATAQEQLARQLVLIENGDRTALQNITQYAQQVLEANQAFNASSAAGQRIQEDVYAAIRALPDAISAEEYLATEIRDALQSVVISAMPTDERLAFELSRELIKLDANQLTVSQVRTALAPIATDAEISKLIREVDVNGDGIITRQELGNARLSGLAGGIGATLKPMFDAIDLDTSGLIDWNEFYGAFKGLASDQELRRIFQKLDADGSGTISRLEALNRSNEGTEANTDSLEKQARDQLRELNGLVSEMARSTDQFVGLNTTMVSLRESINALGVANAERARIERERAAAEQAERERIERERKDTLAAQRKEMSSELSSLKALYSDYQQTIAFNQDPNATGSTTRGGLAEHYKYHSNVRQGASSLEALLSGSYAYTYRPELNTSKRVNQLLGEYNAAMRGIGTVEREIERLTEALNNMPRFSQGGAFTNSVVNTPTMFNMGLMGEAGPEAIMPLHRDASGSLGVRAELPPLPQFPQLGNNDVLQALNDVKRELVETRKQNQRLQEENNRHAAAAVAVQQEGFRQQISEQKKGNAALGTMASKARLEGLR